MRVIRILIPYAVLATLVLFGLAITGVLVNQNQTGTARESDAAKKVTENTDTQISTEASSSESSITSSIKSSNSSTSSSTPIKVTPTPALPVEPSTPNTPTPTAPNMPVTPSNKIDN